MRILHDTQFIREHSALRAIVARLVGRSVLRAV